MTMYKTESQCICKCSKGFAILQIDNISVGSSMKSLKSRSVSSILKERTFNNDITIPNLDTQFKSSVIIII
ncbi:MAG: hypothetical protein B6226_00800 [Candidatus Cloacimonetes bacterium 4572_65]|nr:MAG: hypothetical protein B6226_00800 [Candidatus Cloacimonetes bacterium 4572_65]